MTATNTNPSRAQDDERFPRVARATAEATVAERDRIVALVRGLQDDQGRYAFGWSADLIDSSRPKEDQG